MAFEEWYQHTVGDNLNNQLARWCAQAWDTAIESKQQEIDELKKKNDYYGIEIVRLISVISDLLKDNEGLKSAYKEIDEYLIEIGENDHFIRWSAKREL